MTKPNSREYPTGVVLTFTTGKCLMDFNSSALQELAGYVAGGVVATHQLPDMADRCRSHMLSIVGELEPYNGEGEAYARAYLARAIERLGNTITITPMPIPVARSKQIVEDLQDAMGEDRVIAVPLEEVTQH